MTPRTRSGRKGEGGGGEAPSSRVYNSTPSLRQVQFPARRKRIRDNDRFEESCPSTSSSRLKQQTLTQIDFVSSFTDEDLVQLSSDSEAEENTNQINENKENFPTKKLKRSVEKKDNKKVTDEKEIEKDEGGEDDMPTSRQRKRKTMFEKTESKSTESKTAESKTKRRRTLGDDVWKNVKRDTKASRRRTLGDSPGARFRTQTLTQLVRPLSVVADSDDDDAEEEELFEQNEDNDGFLSWLGGDPQSPSLAAKGARKKADALSNNDDEAVEPNSSRAESVIPQTPIKTIRFQIPESGKKSTPSSVQMARYGAPNKQQQSPSSNKRMLQNIGGNGPASPAKSQRRVLFVEDSYATESWDSTHGTPTGSVSQSQRFVTPAEEHIPSSSPPPAQTSNVHTSTSTGIKENETKNGFPFSKPEVTADKEIPDSDDEDDGYSDITEKEDDASNSNSISNDNDNGANLVSKQPDTINKEQDYDTGAETQLILDQLSRITSAWEQPNSNSKQKQQTQPRSTIPEKTIDTQSTPSATPFSSAREHQTPPPPPKSQQRRKREPLHHPELTSTQGLPAESQRVPVSVLHSFSPASVRTDILLPITSVSLQSILEGYEVAATFPFKIPHQVARFWFLDDGLLRFMAIRSQPAVATTTTGTWSYHIQQIYELNNPVHEPDMRVEEWISGRIERYTYFPPAVVSQLLWNLRHALFNDATELGNEPGNPQPKASSPVSVRKIAAAHTRSSSTVSSTQDISQDDDMISSTPKDNEGASEECILHHSAMPPPELPTIPTPTTIITHHGRQPNFSQATTASEASHADGPSRELPPNRESYGAVHYSSDSVAFIDHSGSPVHMPFDALDSSMPLDGSFQLLTKSQMLPESLLQDNPYAPNEIWDSDDEEYEDG